MYRLNQSRMKSREIADRYKEWMGRATPSGEIRMLFLNPQSGIKMICCDDNEALDIFGDDTEAIFCLKPDNIFLSCSAEDLMRVDEQVYLMGDAVAYKLNREDDYADMSSGEMAETCLELIGRMQHVRMGQFCFPVIDLTDETKEDESDEEA